MIPERFAWLGPVPPIAPVSTTHSAWIQGRSTDRLPRSERQITSSYYAFSLVSLIGAAKAGAVF
jgi:hypothetical protein